MQEITFNLNGEEVTVEVEPKDTLLRVLREKLFLTGTKMGCEESECGACTVILDSRPVNSCTVPAAKVHGKTVVTIEGLSKNGELDPLQEAFIEAGAVQCGFCTPGLIMSAVEIVGTGKKYNREELKKLISGHLCRIPESEFR